MQAHLLLDNQLCFALYAASRSVVRAYHAQLEPLGLTYPQYLVLLVLWEEADLSVTRLGERLRLDSGTLTPLLKRLETAGLVTRTRDPSDERIVRIGLTTAGHDLQAQAAGIPYAVGCRSGLAPDELVRLRDTLHQLTQNLQENP